MGLELKTGVQTSEGRATIGYITASMAAALGSLSASILGSLGYADMTENETVGGLIASLILGLQSAFVLVSYIKNRTSLKEKMVEETSNDKGTPPVEEVIG